MKSTTTDTSVPAAATGESELYSAIAAFERILEVMPTDRLALETLADAYQKLGDITRASQFFNRLVDIVVNEKDVQAAANLLEKFKPLTKDPTLSLAKTRLEDMVEQAKDAKTAPEKVTIGSKADITREISLAWELLQAGQFSQEDYSHVVQDLSENSTKRLDVPVTVLHALADRHYKGVDKIVAHLSRTSGRPIIPLASFELNKDAVALLPLDFGNRRGAICFDLMATDALVAVLNPLDKELQEDIKRITRRNCHFYVTSSTDYDVALTNVRKILAK